MDTFNYFNGFGQGVILALIQVGGLGFLTLVTFINLILGKKLGWSTVKIAASDLTDNALETTPKRLFCEIVLYSFAINLSALSYFRLSLFRLRPRIFFETIFLSVSAFCNAGFDLLTATPGAVGLSEYTNNPLVMITLIVLITTGGLGFIVWRNIRHYSKAKRLLLHTKLVLIMAAVIACQRRYNIYSRIQQSGHARTDARRRKNSDLYIFKCKLPYRRLPYFDRERSCLYKK